jgi:hypothetical protein
LGLSQFGASKPFGHSQWPGTIIAHGVFGIGVVRFGSSSEMSNGVPAGCGGNGSPLGCRAAAGQADREDGEAADEPSHQNALSNGGG